MPGTIMALSERSERSDALLAPANPDVVLAQITDLPPRPARETPGSTKTQALAGLLERAPLASAFDCSGDGFERLLCDGWGANSALAQIARIFRVARMSAASARAERPRLVLVCWRSSSNRAAASLVRPAA